MKKIIVLIVLIMIVFSCVKNDKMSEDKTVVNVAEAVGTGEVLNLSDYAISIEYVPLETNDSVLISKINQIAYENDKIIIRTANEECLIFDGRGKYQCSLGHKGGGPDEFSSIVSFDVLSSKQQIFLHTYPHKYFLYSFNGELLKIIPYINLEDDCLVINTMNVFSKYYYSDVASYVHARYKGFLFEDQDSISVSKRRYENHTDSVKNNKSAFSYIHEVAHMYRYKDELCLHKNINDTIFRIDSTLEMNKKYTFEFGKYRAPTSWLLEKVPKKVLQYIWLLDINESDRFLFLNFFLGNYAPEKFEYIKISPTGTRRTLINYGVHGLFDKQTGRLRLLNQPIAKQFGFMNDIDGGPCCWPKYVTSDEKMIMYWSAGDFLDLYEKLPNPSPELRNIAKKLTPDDNPIVMIVTLK